MNTKVKKSKAENPLINALVILACCGYLFPIYLILTNSFKIRAEMYENMMALPAKLSMKYYIRALDKMNFMISLRNSVIMTVFSIVMIVVLTSMTAWVLARSADRWSRFLFGVLVATMLIPFQTIMMPLMQEMNWIGQNLHIQMTDTLPGLMFMYIGFGAGMGVFLYHGFISSVPISLEEAATIDGCSTWGLFWKIVFPILKPTTMTVIILDVIWIWNDYLLPSLTLKSKMNRTIPISTAKFFGQYTISWNEAMAALVVTIIPVALFYLSCQKYIVKGVAAGAVKG